MKQSKLYINNTKDDEFSQIILKELINELTFVALSDGRTFVARLRGRKDDRFIWETKTGFIKTNKASAVITIRKYIPDDDKKPVDKIPISTSSHGW